MTESEYIKELTETTARSKSNTKRLDELTDRIEKLEALRSTVAVVKSELTSILATVKEIKADVKTLKEKPSKWWDKLIVALIGAAVGYLAKVLLGIG